MSDDLIRRRDAIETAYQLRHKPNDEEWDWWLRSFNAIPSADRPQGEWSIDSVDEIELSYGGMAYEPVYKCSHCGRKTESYVRFDKPLMPEDADFPNFCGWCGARMKGADDE